MGLGASESALRLSLVDVWGIEFLSGGSQQLLVNDPQKSAQLSEQMQAVVDKRVTDDVGNVVTLVSMTLKITSRFAAGWSGYATESPAGVEDDDVTLHRRLCDRDTVEIEFGTLGSTATNVPDYDDGVVCSGVAAYADDLISGPAGAPRPTRTASRSRMSAAMTVTA